MKKYSAVVAVMTLLVASSAKAELSVPGVSDPDACHTVTTEKCSPWNGLTIKEDPDACKPQNVAGEKCFRWYSVGPPKPAPQKVIVLKGIRFDTASAKLRPDALPILEKNVNALQENPRTKIRIVGHTDSRGSNEYNEELSENRAQSVVDYFTSKGIDHNRMVAEGRGESEPTDSNDTEEGRFNNRRIEIHIR